MTPENNLKRYARTVAVAFDVEDGETDLLDLFTALSSITQSQLDHQDTENAEEKR